MAYKLLQGLDVPKDPLSAAVTTIPYNHAEMGAGRAFVMAGFMSVANTETGAVQLSVPAAAAATVTVDMTNHDVTYTAKQVGRHGNQISVVHVVAGNSTPLTVGWNCQTQVITVNVATNVGGTATSTATQVAAAVNASAAGRFVTATAEGDGTGVVEAKTSEDLVGGIDNIDVYLTAVRVASNDGDVEVTLKDGASFAAAGTAFVPVNRNRTDSNASQVTAKFLNNTSITDTSGKVDLAAVLIAAATPGKIDVIDAPVLLARNRNYVLELENKVGSAAALSYQIEWYEHAHREYEFCK